MPTVDIWARLAKDLVTIEPYSGQNRYGEATYGSAVTYRAHCQGKIQRITGLDGQEHVSQVTSYLIGTVAVSTRDRITLPSRFSPTQPPILAVRQVSSERGWHHSVAMT
ncbi:MAG: hypothetical protein NUW22_12615 [Acidobacteria bacterium]|nr:hypothetical protein [Acidobacteriota bacterium]